MDVVDMKGRITHTTATNHGELFRHTRLAEWITKRSGEDSGVGWACLLDFGYGCHYD